MQTMLLWQSHTNNEPLSNLKIGPIKAWNQVKAAKTGMWTYTG